MSQPVMLPATPVAVSAEAPGSVIKGENNQVVTEEFSGLLALLGGPAGALSALPASAPPGQDGGQDLPVPAAEVQQDGGRLPLAVVLHDFSVDTGVASASAGEQAESPERVDQVASLPVQTGLAGLAGILTDPLTDPRLTATERQGGPVEATLPAGLVRSEGAPAREIWMQRLLQLQPLSSERPDTQSAGDTVDAGVDSFVSRMHNLQLPAEALPKQAVRAPDIATVSQLLRRFVAAPAAGDVRLGADVAATVATAQSATHTSSGVTDMPALTLTTPFQKAGWSQELGEKIQWMVSQRMQGAEIRLNPAHLGPMEVKIQVHNDQATVHFASAHGVVRDALEAALPRLRELFDNQGVQLGNVNVSEHSFAQQRRQDGGERLAGHAGQAADGAVVAEPESAGPGVTTPVSSSGWLDVFV